MLQTNETIVNGSGEENDPWKISIGDDGDLPDFSLTAYALENDSNQVERVNIGLASTIAIMQVKYNLHVEIRAALDLLSMPLNNNPQLQIPVLLPKVNLTLFLHDAFDNNQIELLDMAGLLISLEGLKTSLEWRRTQSIGWLFSINCPRIGSICPDFEHLGSQITPAEMNGFTWRNGKLKIEGIPVIIPDFESFIDNNDDPADEIIILPETNQNITVKWDFFGLACESMGFNTWSGLFGFIDTDPNVNSFIDLEPNQSIIENEGVRMVAGQMLALKGGSLGFFLSTFFRINPHLLHYDLGKHLERYDFEFNIEKGGPSNWPSNWAAYHPRGRGMFGLGPFSLPYDWPEVNWGNLLNNPANEFKSFLSNVFSGVSLSGEPFALCALRWIEGLFQKSLPDLSSISLGWQHEISNGIKTVILPDISDETEGDGTHGNPWKARISNKISPNFELLIWLDPDGPDASNQIENVLTSDDLNILKILEEDSFDIMKLVQQTPDNWSEKTAELLIRLSNFSPRIKHSIGDVSVRQLAIDLLEVDQFLKTGDGFSSYVNQVAANKMNIDTTQKGRFQGTYTTSLQSLRVIGEIFDFIRDFTSSEWQPHVHDPAEPIVLILHNLNNVSFSNQLEELRPTYVLEETIKERFDLNTFSLQSFDWDFNMTVNKEHFEPYKPVIAQGGIIEVRLSSRFNQETSLLEGLAEQIRITINSIHTLFGAKVAIVAHGVTGNALQDLVENNVIDETTVSGILTVNTPHEIDSMNLINNHELRRGLHLLSLLDYDIPLSSDDERKYLTREELLQTVRKSSETIIQHTKGA